MMRNLSPHQCLPRLILLNVVTCLLVMLMNIVNLLAHHNIFHYMHAPNTVQMQVTKRLLHYLKGTLDYGLHLRPSSDLHLRAFCDSDWGGDSTDMKSSVAYIIYLGPNAIYLGPVRNIKQLPNHPRRQSIEPLVPLQLKFFCYENFSKIFISISLAHHMYTPTTLEPHIYVSTRCSTLA